MGSQQLSEGFPSARQVEHLSFLVRHRELAWNPFVRKAYGELEHGTAHLAVHAFVAAPCSGQAVPTSKSMGMAHKWTVAKHRDVQQPVSVNDMMSAWPK